MIFPKRNTATRQTTASFAASPRSLDLTGKALRRLLNQGPLATFRRAAFLAHEWYRDWRLGIDTQGFIHWYELGSDPASVDYDPIGYRTLDRALRQVDIRPGVDVFLDYGCGKGRPLLAAATRPFRRVIGVEISADLCRAAIANRNRAKRRLRCRDVRLVHADAASYIVPDDVTVIFLFNPFRRHMLAATVQQIQASLLRCPRRMTILYVLPVNSPDIFASCRWLELRSDALSEGLRLRVYAGVLTNTDAATGDDKSRRRAARQHHGKADP